MSQVTQFRITVTGTRAPDGLVRFVATTTPSCPSIEQQLNGQLHRLFEFGGEGYKASYVFEMGPDGVPATAFEGGMKFVVGDEASEVKDELEDCAAQGAQVLADTNKVLSQFGSSSINYGEVDRIAAAYLKGEELRLVDPDAPAFDFSKLDVEFAKHCSGCGKFHEDGDEIGDGMAKGIEARLRSIGLGGIGVVLVTVGGMLGNLFGGKKDDTGKIVVKVDARFGGVFPDYFKSQLLGTEGEKGILQTAIETRVVEIVQQQAASIVAKHGEFTQWAAELNPDIVEQQASQRTDFEAEQVRRAQQFGRDQAQELEEFQRRQAQQLERFQGNQARDASRFADRQAGLVEQRFAGGEGCTAGLKDNVASAAKLADLMALLTTAGLTASRPEGFDQVVEFKVEPVAPRPAPVVEPEVNAAGKDGGNGDPAKGRRTRSEAPTRKVEPPVAQA